MNTSSKQLEALLENHGDALYNYARLKVGDPDQAADLVQDTFEAAIKGFHSFRGESQGRTWLFGILRNKIMDFYKAKYREQGQGRQEEEEDLAQYFTPEGAWRPEAVPQPATPHLLDQPEFLKTLYRCLDKLPNLWKSVLEGKFLLEKETADLCQDLDISVTNYWQLSRRAKLAMQQCLQANWFKMI